MSDVFDEVSKILSEAESSNATEDKSSFNNNELDDIMNEIENLEKEFTTKKTDTPMPKLDKVTEELIVDGISHVANESKLERMAHVKLSLQEEIDRELANSNVVQLKATAPQTSSAPVTKSSTASSSPMKMSLEGQAKIDLSFMLKNSKADVSVDPEKGVSVFFGGVKISIDSSSGCTISMDNGTTMTIPLTVDGDYSKKKTA